MRRLRYRSDDEEVELPAPRDGNDFHLFLSHVWGTGQDQMRIVKQRLLEMVPSLRIFLDVDDLEEIGDLEGYIERTSTIIVYCSDGYFKSKNCMRELVYATLEQKPLIALIDLEPAHGGLAIDHILKSLVDGANRPAGDLGVRGGPSPDAGVEGDDGGEFKGGLDAVY